VGFDNTPEDFELTSPDGAYQVHVEFGFQRPSVLSSGYGKPFYKTKVLVAAVTSLDHHLVNWHKDAERIQVSFEENSQFVEICSEMAGCIHNSSGVRHFREIYALPSGIEVVSEYSDFCKTEQTRSRPNPSGSKASVHLADMVRSRVWQSYQHWQQLPDIAELMRLLSVVAQSQNNISGSPGAVRHLVSVLCRDLGAWSDQEVELRLLIVRILNRIKFRSPNEFVDLLIPRGRIPEPVREEHNRLADAFVRKLLNTSRDQESGNAVMSFIRQAMGGGS